MTDIYRGRLTPPGEFFPYTDITSETASVIKPLLEDGLAIAECHNSIEATYPLYKIGHAALTSLALQVIPENREQISFLHGVTLYEVTATIVRPWAPKYAIGAAEQQAEYFKNLGYDQELITYEFADAFERFIATQQTAAKLVAASTKEVDFFDQTFILQGAAMARALETNVIEAGTGK